MSRKGTANGATGSNPAEPFASAFEGEEVLDGVVRVGSECIIRVLLRSQALDEDADRRVSDLATARDPPFGGFEGGSEGERDLDAPLLPGHKSPQSDFQSGALTYLLLRPPSSRRAPLVDDEQRAGWRWRRVVEMNVVRTLVDYTVPGFIWRPGFLRPLPPPPRQTDAVTWVTASKEGRLLIEDDSAKAAEERGALVLAAEARMEEDAHFELTPRARMDLDSRLESTPTLLPQNLASFITAASLAARVSLRSSAFLIELIFEASRYGTSAGLGITRRALISAVSSASVLQKSLGTGGEETDEAFLGMLDRYTAVGCYLVHSVFTMAELFAIAGLQLTQSAFSTGFGAAEESVRMFDSLFGSNESSRALSAIIMLVRRELLQDPRFTPSQAGTVASLVALTKALTAFACLQVATRRRTVAGMKMRVVWDATVVAESEDDGAANPFRIPDRHGEVLVGQIQRARAESSADLAATAMHRTPDRKDRRKSIMRLSESDREGLVTDVRTQMESGRTWLDDCGPVTSGASSFHSRRSRSFARVNSMGTLASAGEQMASQFSDYELEQQAEEEEGQEIAFELKQMLGEDEEEGEVVGGDDLPEDVKQALLQVARGDADAEGVQVVSMRNRDHPAADEGVRLVQMNGASALFEVTTTTTETTTTTTVKTTAPVQSSSASHDRPPLSTASSAHRHRASSSRGKIETVFNSPLTRSKSVTEASQLFQEDEWVEVASRLSRPRSDSKPTGRPSAMDIDIDGEETPRSGYVTPTVGALARTTTLESPEEGKQKLQVVLKTMTKKLTQRRHMVRRVDEVFEQDGGYSSRDRDREVEWKAGSAGSSMEGLDPPPPKKALLRTLGGKAKNALKKSPSALDIRGKSKRGAKRKASKAVLTTAASSPASSPPPRHGEELSGGSEPGTPGQGTVPFPVTEDEDTTMQTALAPSRSKHDYLSPLPVHDDVFMDTAPPRGLPKSGSVRTHRTTRTARTQVETNAVSSGEGPPMAVYPKGPLVRQLAKYMRYASAAYGQHFLRIMGIGVDAFNYPNTKGHHSNHHAFASHVGIPVDQILLSSFVESPGFSNDQLQPLVHYLVVDHDAQSIVLTIRGTLGLSDLLLDLTCQYEPVEVDGGEADASYLAHSGMLHSAYRLRKGSSTVHEAVKEALLDHPSYGLVLSGHSLGGGVGALLAVLFSTKTETFVKEAREADPKIRHPPLITPFVTSFKSGLPPGRPIHCYAYGCPAVASADLGQYAKGLVTTVAHGIDMVPTLSLGVLADLKNVAVSLYEEEHVASEIVGRVIGLYQSQRRRQKARAANAAAGEKENVPPVSDGEGIDALPTAREVVEVEMDDEELAKGRGANLAGRKGYTDPALMVADLGKEDEDSPELADWLWSLMRTMRASSDAEKLYPPGDVWHVETSEVFVESKQPATPRKDGSKKRTRRQGRRIILRSCEDVPARYSEPIFGKTMLHDHIPTNYELALQLLEEAASPSE